MFKLKDLRACEGENLLDGISLCISEKGIYGVLLPDEKARVDLADIIAGVSCKYDGEIEIKSNTYCSEDPEKKRIEHRRKVGYMSSSVSLYGDMTAYETLDFIGSAKKISSDKKYKQIKEALELTGMDSAKNILVSKLDTSQLRRISLAAALLGNPDIIVLDEPFWGLDKVSTDNFKGLINMIGGVKCVILLTSSADGIEELCKSIAVIVNGKLVINDSTENIYNRINSTQTILVRIISKSEDSIEKVCEAVAAIDGVISCEKRSVSEQGETVLNIECGSQCDVEAKLSDVIKDSGYILLSSETIRLTLKDLCSVMVKKEEV